MAGNAPEGCKTLKGAAAGKVQNLPNLEPGT
jgi:hypothetical protein